MGGGGAHESKQCTKTMENMKRYLKKKPKTKKQEKTKTTTRNKKQNKKLKLLTYLTRKLPSIRHLSLVILFRVITLFNAVDLFKLRLLPTYIFCNRKEIAIAMTGHLRPILYTHTTPPSPSDPPPPPPPRPALLLPYCSL